MSFCICLVLIMNSKDLTGKYFKLAMKVEGSFKKQVHQVFSTNTLLKTNLINIVNYLEMTT